MHPPLSISIATLDEADAVVRLVNAAYRGESAVRGWTHEAGLLDGQRLDRATLCDAMADGATVLMLREDDAAATLAGCVSIEPKEASDAWYLGMLTIDPGRQASGLGRRLLMAAEDHARRHGATTMVMTVIHLRASLIAWYERCGYRRTGQTTPFPYGDERFGVPRRADLHFVVLDKRL